MFNISKIGQWTTKQEIGDQAISMMKGKRVSLELKEIALVCKRCEVSMFCVKQCHMPKIRVTTWSSLKVKYKKMVNLSYWSTYEALIFTGFTICRFSGDRFPGP